MAAFPSQSSVFLSTYQIEDDALDNESSRKLFWQCFFFLSLSLFPSSKSQQNHPTLDYLDDAVI